MAQANGASISLVHDTLLDLANKDQQGFVSDAEFNNFAQIAQLNIYNRLFGELKDAKRLSRAGFNPMRDKSKLKRIEEDLSFFSKKETVTHTSGLFLKPTDMSRIIGMTTAGSILLDQSTKKSIEICYDEEKIERILSSTLNAPTESLPVALVTQDIEVFPETIKKIKLRYYKIPQSVQTDGVTRSDDPPTFGVASGVVDTYNSSTSRDFELPEHYTMELVAEIASLIGVNLRDQQVTSFAATEQAERQSEHSF
ncbi:MAG TPA: hypothetical protein DCL39_12815 [Alteromonas macleodii]|nr:hypothetical protein [Alteromonas macleodii]